MFTNVPALKKDELGSVLSCKVGYDENSTAETNMANLTYRMVVKGAARQERGSRMFIETLEAERAKKAYIYVEVRP